VAQAFALLASLPSAFILSVTIALASASAVLVGSAVATTVRSQAIGRAVALPLAALLPFWFPYTVGMLFGNLDMFFPALYGIVLVAVLRPRGARDGDRWIIAAGI